MPYPVPAQDAVRQTVSFISGHIRVRPDLVAGYEVVFARTLRSIAYFSADTVQEVIFKLS